MATTQNRVGEILLAQAIRRRASIPRRDLVTVLKELLDHRATGGSGDLADSLLEKRLLGADALLALTALGEVTHADCARCGEHVAAGRLASPTAPCPACGAAFELPPLREVLRSMEQTTMRRKRRPNAGAAEPISTRLAAADVSHDETADPELPAGATTRRQLLPPAALDGKLVAMGASDSGLRAALGAGNRFGGYEVLEELAQGGMGIVYKARQSGLNRMVALKVLKDKLSTKEESLQRFQREARAASRMHHPHIVSIIEVGNAEGVPFMTMDFIDGTPLDEIIAKGPIDPQRAVGLLKKIADAMRYAHGCDVVHRDLKPSNIIVDRDGEPHITDFGLAKRLDSKSRLTETGALVGTPYYMAPEQIAGDGRVSKSWDLYALGVILYEMLTGELPFDGETTMEVYHKILNQDPTPPRELAPAVPAAVEHICLKAMMREEALRYRSVAELLRDVEAYLEMRPISARPLGVVGRFFRRFERHTALYTVILCALVIATGSLAILGLRLYRRYADRPAVPEVVR